MAIEFARRRRPRSDISLTAMIDVVFILIFFFMLTTSFVQIESMNLMLPSSSVPAKQAATAQVLILHNDGTLRLNQKSIAKVDMPGKLSQIMGKNPDASWVLLVDDGVDMQGMMHAVDALQSVGSRNLYIRPLKK